MSPRTSTCAKRRIYSYIPTSVEHGLWGGYAQHMVLDEGTGLYTAEEYDQAVYDITNFLHYVGDPSRLERHRLGVYVLLFLVILYVFTWLLGREYNKAVR